MAESNFGSYVFEVESTQNPNFTVSSINGNERLGEPYCFDVDVVSTIVGLNLAELMGKPALLAILPPWNGNPVIYQGLITRAQIFGETLAQKTHYRLRLEPTISVLKQTTLNYVYTNITQGYSLSSLLTAVFNRYSLQSGTNYQINLRPPIETRELIMQFEETDFHFMQRWLEYEGAYYYFKQGSEGEEMVIVDDTSNLPTNSISLKYMPEGTISQTQATEGLMHFAATQEFTIQSVQLQDYNYRHAQSLVEGSSQNNQALWGTIFSFGGNLLTNEHAKKYAQLRVEAAGTLGMVVRGKTQVTGITAGSLISVSQHPDQSLNTQFRVISVHHAGMQTGFGVGVSKQDESTEETNFYTATFEVIPTSTQFRLPLKTPRPRIYGFLPGIIDGEGDGKTPELDGQGRYKVKFPFACNNYSPGKASPWIRMATPYGGGGEQGNSGLSFPLLIGTEVMLIFNNGDPDLPEIAGALANSITPNTVNNQNPSVNQMISHGGNQLQLDDTNNTSGIRFLSNQGSMMYLGAFGGKFGTPGDESNS